MASSEEYASLAKALYLIAKNPADPSWSNVNAFTRRRFERLAETAGQFMAFRVMPLVSQLETLRKELVAYRIAERREGRIP